jgi:hypothetical protein
MGGYIGYPAMARALAHGYATASTDTGHATEGASFARGHPEKLVDFGSRAVHEMTVEAKALIAFFSQPGATFVLEQLLGRRAPTPDGGRAFSGGLRRHRGGCAVFLSHLQPWTLWVAKVVHESEGSFLPLRNLR